MRLGLVGLGRIGAFRANTFVGIPAIDSLVAVDIVPAKTKQIVDRFGAQGVDSLKELFARWPIRSLEPGINFPSGKPHRFFMDRFLPAFRAEFETFIDVVAGNRRSPCIVADGLEADWFAEACTKSAKEHRSVRMRRCASHERRHRSLPGAQDRRGADLLGCQ